MGKANEPPHPDRTIAEPPPRALVGWLHHELPTGIELKLQATKSTVGLENQQIDTWRLLLTRNQALLLGNYLLRLAASDGAVPPTRDGRGRLARWFRPRDWTQRG